MDRLALNSYDDVYTQTTTVQFVSKSFQFGDQKVRVGLWNLYRQMNMHIYEGIDVVLIGLDLSVDFETTKGHLNDFLQDFNVSRKNIIVLGLKSDIEICETDVADYCFLKSLQFVSTSAKTGYNVDYSLFRSLIAYGLIKCCICPQLNHQRLQKATLAQTSKITQIRCFWQHDDIFLLQNAALLVFGRFLFIEKDFVYEIVSGNDLYVCYKTIDATLAKRAKAVLVLCDVRQKVGFRVPVFQIVKEDDVADVLGRIARLF